MYLGGMATEDGRSEVGVCRRTPKKVQGVMTDIHMSICFNILPDCSFIEKYG